MPAAAIQQDVGAALRALLPAAHSFACNMASSLLPGTGEGPLVTVRDAALQALAMYVPSAAAYAMQTFRL